MNTPFDFTPSMPGGVGAPYPFNFNDARVWKALICKYLCQNNLRIFNKSDFYKAFLRNEFPQGGAYVEPLRTASQNDRHLFDELLDFSLDSLSKFGLLKRTERGLHDIEYTKTPRLDIFCKDMLKYDMFDVDLMVEPILSAEKEILNYKDLPDIIEMLEALKVKHTDIQEASQRVDPPTINKLNQLGMILINLEGVVMISPIGIKVLSDISQRKLRTKV